MCAFCICKRKQPELNNEIMIIIPAAKTITTKSTTIIQGAQSLLLHRWLYCVFLIGGRSNNIHWNNHIRERSVDDNLRPGVSSTGVAFVLVIFLPTSKLCWHWIGLIRTAVTQNLWVWTRQNLHLRQGTIQFVTLFGLGAGELEFSPDRKSLSCSLVLNSMEDIFHEMRDYECNGRRMPL